MGTCRRLAVQPGAKSPTLKASGRRALNSYPGVEMQGKGAVRAAIFDLEKMLLCPRAGLHSSGRQIHKREVSSHPWFWEKVWLGIRSLWAWVQPCGHREPSCVTFSRGQIDKELDSCLMKLGWLWCQCSGGWWCILSLRPCWESQDLLLNPSL